MENRRFLIVSFTSGQKYTGGIQCSNRNYESLVALFGKTCVYKYIIEPYQNKSSLSTLIKRIIDIFYGAMGGLDKIKTKEIIEIINKNNITDVFIDSSLLGLLAKRIKKVAPKIRIYTFFHNFEKGFVNDSIKINKDYIRFYWSILTKINEKSAIKYSDKIIALNNRDKEDIENFYNRKVDKLIPITLKDTTTPVNTEILSTNSKALFVGSYFFGNTEGLKWFCTEVLPYVNINFTIVGSSMDKLKNELPPSDKIRIYSNVPDLKPYYEEADFIVLPILSGSGMKVKTAECLMNGKFIIGTTEAFTGYDINKNHGIICNSAEEFIETINNIDIKYKYNSFSKDLFDQKYSFESSLTLFEEVFKL